ncbi:serine/arginine repetitive matrix protein 2-like [Piliocolobus tephrosceles]|uniref:serine/arginine repetitive matrix protein 2-like n=1 Tax=Piliocolobus tephrosceles TaxID=591936 RepID=UPI001300FABF|nr:serine/arginine repetitive matrix protein 2-like [Piliocolobus tephrosceles]
MGYTLAAAQRQLVPRGLPSFSKFLQGKGFRYTEQTTPPPGSSLLASGSGRGVRAGRVPRPEAKQPKPQRARGQPGLYRRRRSHVGRKLEAAGSTRSAPGTGPGLQPQGEGDRGGATEADASPARLNAQQQPPRPTRPAGRGPGQGPACARALAASPAEFNTMPTPTPCATPRPAKQPQRRGRGWPRQGEGMSARESRRQRETRGGRKRASRCSWEKRQRGRACSGRTGSLPSPSLLPPLPQTHFRSSRPCRRSSSGGSSRRRRRGVGRITHLTGPPPRAPARDAHRSPPPRAHFAVAVGREGPATGNGTRIAPLPFLPPSLRSAARPLGFRPLPLPQNPGWSRCRLAAAWLRGMVLSSGQSPGARRSRHRPREAPLPSLPRTGPRVARALRLPAPRALGRGSFVVFVATAAAGTVCELRWPPLPPPVFPYPGLGVARGHRPREAEAVRAYLSPVLLRRGVWRRRCWAASAVLSSPPPPPPLPLAAGAAAAAAAVGVSGAAAAAAAGLFLSGYVKVT